MKYSFHLPVERVKEGEEFTSLRALQEMVQALERAGIDACYVTDHPIPSDEWLQWGGHHSLDPFVTLSFVAAVSERIKLHTNIVVLAYRSPFITAKQVASLDVLSSGRVILGVGAGYLKEEFAALGVSLEGRGAAMDEALDIMKRAWTGETVKYVGPRFQVDGNTSLPVPTQKPHPPIWVGGNSDNAIRRAVEFCDGWLPFPAPAALSAIARTDQISNLADLKRKLMRVKSLREELGRCGPFDICMVPFELDMQSHRRPEKQQIIDQLSLLQEAGVTWASISLPCNTRGEYIENTQWFGAEIMATIGLSCQLEKSR